MKYLALLLAFATACLAKDTVRIGEFSSLTGKEASFGQSTHKGISMAVEEINTAGGVLGRQLELFTEDNQSKPGESATAAKKLISRNKVEVLIGEVASSRSLEAAPVAQRAKIPMISPASTNETVTQTGDYIFRVCFIDPFQGTVMAKFAKQDLKAKRVAILSSVSSAYSVGLAKSFRHTFVADGGEIAAEQKYSEGDKDFRAQLTAIKAANVDGIFVPGYYTEAALLVRQARDLGINLPLFGGDGWVSDELLAIGGPALNGCFYSTHFSPANQDPLVQEFVTKFKSKWNGQNPDAFAALGYDSVYVLVDAIKRAGTSEGPALRDALASTKDYVGVTGKTEINAQRDASKPAAIISIRDTKLEFLKTVAP